MQAVSGRQEVESEARVDDELRHGVALAMVSRASTGAATGAGFILRTFLLLHSMKASRRSILLCRQKEALKGIMCVGSSVRITVWRHSQLNSNGSC
jgi:hypothetical protein